eukprot:3977038-Alexandrium_andersonii.AAC.1
MFGQLRGSSGRRRARHLLSYGPGPPATGHSCTFRRLRCCTKSLREASGSAGQFRALSGAHG